MPSDDVLNGVGAAFAPATEAFRSAVIDAVEQVRTYVDEHRAPSEAPGPRLAAELGPFAAGHIDAERFAALFGGHDTLDASTIWLLDQALATLRDQSDRTDPTVHTEVPPGGDVRATVEAELASVGRAFGAARIAELVRSGRIEDVRKADPAAAFPFAKWTAAERRIAPPLFVRLTGADLEAGALAGFLDGNQKIVLIVDAPAPPAPLATLITPGTFVMQTADASELPRMAAFDGPGIAALVPDGCATFVHDPVATDSPLVVTHRPDAKLRALRRSSVFQQSEALALLDRFAAALMPGAGAMTPVLDAPSGAGAASGTVAAPTSTTPSTPAGAADPADTLAAWLLSQAGLGAAAGSVEQ
jgi:hypothetical protein